MRTALKVAVTGALLALVVGRTDLAAIGRALAGAGLSWVAAALALHGVGLLLSAVRWRLLLRAQGADVPLGFLAGSLLTGVFFNNFLPSTVGGDVSRARDTAPHAGSFTRAATVVLVERASGIAVLGLFGLAAPLFGRTATGGGAVPSSLWSAVCVLLGGCAAFAVLLRPAPLAALRSRVERRAAAARAGTAAAGALARAGRLVETLEALARRPRILASAFLLALALQANVILHYWCLARALALPVPLPALFFIVPVATVVLLLPVSINGIGAREAVFAVLLGAHGVSVADSLAFSWIAYGLVLAQGLLGGLMLLARRGP